jgi:uncharacterized cupin superfamily protein
MTQNFTAMPFADVPDSAPDSGMGDILEARFARELLGCQTIGLSHQRIKPGVRAPFAHKHAADEEVYVILGGSGEARIDGETIPLAAMTVVRCAPEAVRAFAAGDDGLELLAFGTHTQDDGEFLGDPWS